MTGGLCYKMGSKMGRYDNWNTVQVIVGDRWDFRPAPDGNGIIGIGRHGLMSPKDMDEIFEGLQQFFDFYGREKVQSLCDERDEYMSTCDAGTEPPNILPLLYPEEYKRLREKAVKSHEALSPVMEPDHSGLVYVIRADNGFCKIGYTKDVIKRLNQLETASPCELELIIVIKAEDMYELEKELHARYADRQKKGEWFALTEPDIKYLKGLESESEA